MPVHLGLILYYFTQFYNGTLPNNAVDFSVSGDININDGRALPQILKSVKQKNLNIISTSDLEDVAVALRDGRDVITMPQNIRLLEKKFKDFDGRKYPEGSFPVAEEYQKKIMAFKTNYRSLDLAQQKIFILSDLIDKIGRN